MIFEKLVPSNVTSIHAGNSVVHQQFCIELRHTCGSRNSSEALPKIVAPLRQRGSILLLLDEVPRCAVGGEYPFGKAEGGGSGWVILAYSPRDKRLVNQWAADHTTTLAGGRPILVLDMYEHAYHMDYGAAAARYVDVFMEAIRWDNAVKLYDRYSRDT